MMEVMKKFAQDYNMKDKTTVDIIFNQRFDNRTYFFTVNFTILLRRGLA